jgi:hypothetical protein
MFYANYSLVPTARKYILIGLWAEDGLSLQSLGGMLRRLDVRLPTPTETGTGKCSLANCLLQGSPGMIMYFPSPSPYAGMWKCGVAGVADGRSQV